jgi:hypothetical protein
MYPTGARRHQHFPGRIHSIRKFAFSGHGVIVRPLAVADASVHTCFRFVYASTSHPITAAHWMIGTSGSRSAPWIKQKPRKRAVVIIVVIRIPTCPRRKARLSWMSMPAGLPTQKSLSCWGRMVTFDCVYVCVCMCVCVCACPLSW